MREERGGWWGERPNDFHAGTLSSLSIVLHPLSPMALNAPVSALPQARSCQRRHGRAHEGMRAGEEREQEEGGQQQDRGGGTAAAAVAPAWWRRGSSLCPPRRVHCGGLPVQCGVGGGREGA